MLTMPKFKRSEVVIGLHVASVSEPFEVEMPLPENAKEGDKPETVSMVKVSFLNHDEPMDLDASWAKSKKVEAGKYIVITPGEANKVYSEEFFLQKHVEMPR